MSWRNPRSLSLRRPEPCRADRPRWLPAFLLLLLALSVPCAPLWAAGLPLKVGVLAYRPKAEILAQWQPTADFLASAVPGERFVVEALDYPELAQAVATRQVDFVFTNPGHYVLMVKRKGLAPLATLIAREDGQAVTAFGGVILVRAESQELQTLPDLAGKVLASPDTHSLGGYGTQAFELAHAGIHLPEDAQLLVTGMPHDAALEALLAGRADAAFVRTGLVETLVGAGKLDPARIRVINRQAFPGFPFVASTRLYPEWPFSALNHVDRHLARQVAAALYTLPPEHAAAVGGHYWGWTIPADYEPVRALLEELRLPPFDRPPAFTLADVGRRYGAQILIFGVLVLALGSLATRLAVANRHLQVERRRTEAQGEERQRLLAALGEGVYGVDAQGRCTFINAAALAMLGYAAADVLGRDQHALFHFLREDGTLDPAAACPVQQTLGDGRRRETDDEWFLRADGSGFPVSLVVTPVEAAGGRVGAVVVFRDLTERKQMEEQMRLLATTDFLTGLPNRRRFIERLEQELARLRRLDSPPVALLMLDLDLFKKINDSYGHAAGDLVLQHFSGLVRESLRKVDMAGRLGGEEFALLLPGATLENACRYAERLRERIAASPARTAQGLLPVTVSIGVTELRESDLTPDAALARVDAALYRAKEAGRNRVEAEPAAPGEIG